MSNATKRSRWVYFLPTLHLCAYAASMGGLLVKALQPLGLAASFIMLADIPISLVAYALAWKYSSLAAVWILVVGTLWWYLLSRGIELIFRTLRKRGTTADHFHTF